MLMNRRRKKEEEGEEEEEDDDNEDVDEVDCVLELRLKNCIESTSIKE